MRIRDKPGREHRLDLSLQPRTKCLNDSIAWRRLIDLLFKVTLIWCLFSFKIFIVGFGEAGLRPDDLLLLLCLAALCYTGRLRRTPLTLPLRLYFGFLVINVLSAAWNSIQGRVNLLYSLTFVLRLVEYLVFYYVGYHLARIGFNFSRVALCYAYTLCALVPLQMLGLVPVPGTFGRERASGNTNGPYELAIVSSFLLCYLAYRERRRFIGAASLGMIVLTASRITLIAGLLSLVRFSLLKSRSKGAVLAAAAMLALLGGGLYAANSSGLVTLGALDRLGNSKSLALDDVIMLYDAAPVAQNATEYYNGSFQDLNGIDVDNFDGDLSGLIRFTRWITLVKANLSHVDSILIGLGPSFGSAAVDGYYVRVYVESGLIGLIAFLSFAGAALWNRRRSNWYFREYVMIMIISAGFIDIFSSYKSMMLFWLWHGMNQYNDRPRPHTASQPQPSALWTFAAGKRPLAPSKSLG